MEGKYAELKQQFDIEHDNLKAERDSANKIAAAAKFQNERLVERVKAVEQERDRLVAENAELRAQGYGKG